MLWYFIVFHIKRKKKEKNPLTNYYSRVHDLYNYAFMSEEKYY